MKYADINRKIQQIAQDQRDRDGTANGNTTVMLLREIDHLKSATSAYGTILMLREKAEQAEALRGENERLWNGLLAIETRTQGCAEGTTAGEVYKIARYARLPETRKEEIDG